MFGIQFVIGYKFQLDIKKVELLCFEEVFCYVMRKKVNVNRCMCVYILFLQLSMKMEYDISWYFSIGG